MDRTTKQKVSRDGILIAILFSLFVLIAAGPSVYYVAEFWLTDTVYDDLLGPALAARTPVSGQPDFDTFPSGSATKAYCFPDGSTTTLYFPYQTSHRCKMDTGGDLHFHAAPTNTNTGNAIIDIDCSWEGDGVPYSTDHYDVIWTGGGTAEQGQYQDVGMVTDMCEILSKNGLCAFSRIGSDGDDTFTGKLCLTSMDIHYQVDTLGSREETSK